jgi:hypothetical protein
MGSAPVIWSHSAGKIASIDRCQAAERLSKAIVMHRRNSRVCAVANSSLHRSGYNQPQANNDCNNDTYFRHSPKTFCGACRSLERTGALDSVLLVATRTFQSVGVVAHTLSLAREVAHEVPEVTDYEATLGRLLNFVECIRRLLHRDGITPSEHTLQFSDPCF